MLRLRTGQPGLLPSPEEAAAYEMTPRDQLVVDSTTGNHVVGDPERVTAAFDELLERTGADELMITTNIHGHAERLRSVQLVAEAAGIGMPEPAHAGTA
jgi:alkanesulfonate monooxygenase SsuD/methylene tetrahydromethanopterin reductase-like flavin-dependent oxidoreductase (luciferase family)